MIDAKYMGQAHLIGEVRILLAEKLDQPLEKVGLTSNLFEDLGADSLDPLEIRLEIEDRYAIDITDAEAEGIRTVKDVVDLVLAKVPGGAA